MQRNALKVLHLRGNKIQDLSFLSAFPNLSYCNLRGNQVATPEYSGTSGLITLVLLENPVFDTEGYRLAVIGRFQKLDRLDKEPVSDEERDDALRLLKAVSAS